MRYQTKGNFLWIKLLIKFSLRANYVFQGNSLSFLWSTHSDPIKTKTNWDQDYPKRFFILNFPKNQALNDLTYSDGISNTFWQNLDNYLNLKDISEEINWEINKKYVNLLNSILILKIP